MTISIIIPVFNQLEYTKLCLASLDEAGRGETSVIVIDNASTDGTDGYLQSRRGITVISNQENRGCAGAWNQGVKAAGESDWLVLLNNDVIVPKGWLQGLLEASDRFGLDIVCPGVREGDYNYEIERYAGEYTSRMQHAVREGSAHGICFMVRRRVFETIGHFDEHFRIGQFEDADFFRRAIEAGFRIGTAGSSFIHHFGSVTQKSIQKKSPKPYAQENRAYFRRKWKLTWWKRFIERRSRKIREFCWSTREKNRYGHTLMEKWIDGRLRYF